MKYLYLYLIVIFYFSGCGNSSSLKSTPENSSQISTKIDKSSKLIYAHADFNTNCVNEQIFSIYPSLRDAKVQMLDYLPKVHEIGDGEVSVTISQATDPSNSSELLYDYITKSFTSECVPITYSDHTKIYQPFKINVKDNNGSNILATKITLFQSDESNCMLCHKSESFENAKPSKGWANLAVLQEDYKVNILRIHDQKYFEKTSKYIKKALPDYNPEGLEESIKSIVVKCTDCHHIMAIAGSGAKLLPSLTSALHKTHSNLIDPYMANINSCITCHPGEKISPLFMGHTMHKKGTAWIKEHGNITKEIGAKNCKLCHGYDYKGSDLSKVVSPFSFKNLSYNTNDKVNCFDCHSNTKWDMKDGFQTTNSITRGFRR